MTKSVFGIIGGILLCIAFTLPVIADELKVNIGVESGDKATQIVGADIYATIDNKLYEVMVRPDDQAFFLNGKFGALRLRGFWMSNAKTEKIAK